MTPRTLSLALGLALGLCAWGAPLQAQEGAPQQRLSVTVDSIVVRGNQRVSDALVIQESQLRVGMDVSYPSIQKAVRSLFAMGEFSDLQVRVSRGEPVVFYIEVEERPWVVSYDFVGLEHVSPGTVLDTVGLQSRTPLNPSGITRAKEMIHQLLSDEGFPRPRIDTTLVSLPEGHQLVFRVEEGPRLGLARIEFKGNGAFTDARLRDAMKTGEEGFFWFQSGELIRKEYEKDLGQRLPDFYASHGFIDFSVVDDSVYVDSTTGKGRVVVEVDEGPRYHLAEFEVRGNREFPTDRLKQRFEQAREHDLERLPPDSLPPFDFTGFQEATSSVADFYRNSGYLRARVVPTVERLPPDSADGPPRVRAVWNIDEREPAYVHYVHIEGNDFTHDRIIRERVTVLPGDIYSQDRLIQSVQSIQSMGFFERLPPNRMVSMDERENGDVDVTLRVKEKQTGNVNFGLSASAGTGMAGFIGYEQPNLFGQAKQLSFRWLFGSRTQDIEVSYSDPAVLGSRQSLNLALRSSRDQFRGFSLGERRQTGGSVEVGTPLPGLRAARLFVGYSLFKDEVKNLQTFGVDPSERQVITAGTRSTARLRLVRDTRAGGPFPVAGSRNALSARFSGGPLGGDGDYSKYEFESEWYVPVAEIGGGFESNPIRVTTKVGFETGLILGNNPFFRERFFMGGTQIGKQLRGYEEATVTPQGHVPRNARFSQLDRVGESFFSTTVLVGARLTNSVFVSTFADAGNVWGSADRMNPTDLLVGAGVGVSLVTPFGPLGIDYAYGFDRKDVLGRPDPGWKLHFKFGRFF